MSTNRKPTRKQRLYIKNKTLSNHCSDAELIRRSGYSESVAKQPHLVTKSQGVQQLLQEASKDSDWLSPEGIRKCIEKAVKSEFHKAKADTILRFYQLQAQAEPKQQETRNLNINITSKDMLQEAIQIINAGLDKGTLTIKDDKVSVT